MRSEFQRLWGYSQFRPPQEEVIRCLLAGRDALVVLPTGAGKSVCFQLPALLQDGLTLVISPLVALMENQVAELAQRQLPAALYHSGLTARERQQILGALQQQKLRLLYLSPESLLSAAIWERLCQPQLKINGLILDEAHCLIQWGDRFRPAYRRLGTVRSALLAERPSAKIAIAAFTATADPQTQTLIRTALQLQQPQIFQISPYRSNLQLQVKIAWTPRGRRQQLGSFIQSQQGSSGIVYAQTRRDSEAIATWLVAQGYQAAAYHAGLTSSQRRSIETSWLEGQTPVVVATSAFGLGINKPNCRWVAHFQAPTTLPEYVQEVGRAGRDGQPARAVTWMSEPTGWLDPSDRQRRQFLSDQARSQQQSARQLAAKLPAQGDIRTVVRQFAHAEAALALLHSSNQLTWRDPFHYQIHQAKTKLTPPEAAVLQPISAYLTTRQCRWRFLLSSFGFAEGQTLRCGSCDNCLR